MSSTNRELSVSPSPTPQNVAVGGPSVQGRIQNFCTISRGNRTPGSCCDSP